MRRLVTSKTTTKMKIIENASRRRLTTANADETGKNAPGRRAIVDKIAPEARYSNLKVGTFVLKLHTFKLKLLTFVLKLHTFKLKLRAFVLKLHTFNMSLPAIVPESNAIFSPARAGNQTQYQIF
jgi:hypothetical protein